jgi:lactoylglutathione lyase
MSSPALNLIVLRVPDLERAAEFYAGFGLSFMKHAHGKGPEHYAAELGSMVFELYPQASEEASTKHVRIGFQVKEAQAVIQRLEEKGGKVVSPLKESPWGLRAVVDDPFGHRIEICEAADRP